MKFDRNLIKFISFFGLSTLIFHKVQGPWTQWPYRKQANVDMLTVVNLFMGVVARDFKIPLTDLNLLNILYELGKLEIKGERKLLDNPQTLRNILLDNLALSLGWEGKRWTEK